MSRYMAWQYAMQKVPPTLDKKFLGCWFKTIKVEMYEMFKFTWFGIYDDKAKSTANTIVSPEQNQRVVVFSKILAISCCHSHWIIFRKIEQLLVVLFSCCVTHWPSIPPTKLQCLQTGRDNTPSCNTRSRLKINIKMPGNEVQNPEMLDIHDAIRTIINRIQVSTSKYNFHRYKIQY